MDKHTQGPWEALNLADCAEIRSVNGAIIADVHCGRFFTNYKSHAEIDVQACHANANLIAAAPDMLNVLESIENDADQVPAFMWQMIQEVIAKAKGDEI